MAIIAGQPSPTGTGFLQAIDQTGGQPTQPPAQQPIAQPFGLSTNQPTDMQSNPMDYWSRSSENPYGVGTGANLTANAAIWGAYKTIFGRAPTQAELSAAQPSYGTSGVTGVLGFVGNAYQAQNAPTATQLQQQQQQQTTAAYTAGQSGFDQTTSGAFQSLLGRAPTQAELEHFGGMLATGQTDPYELQTYLQQTPEYQTTQNTNFQTSLGKQLNDVSGQYFQKYVAPDIQGQFAASGRDVSGASTGLSFALADAANKVNLQNQQFLAGTSASLYGNSQQAALQNYQGMLGQQYGLDNASFGNQLSNYNNTLAQGWNSANTLSQDNFIKQALGSYKSPGNGSGIGSLIGGGLGAAAGAYFGGPTGAMAGYSAGSGIGGSAGGLFA